MTDETQEKQQPKTRWYRQTTIWAIIISVVALLLSQFPHIRAWIPKNDIKVEIGNRITIRPVLGISGYDIVIDLKNIGNRRLNISNLGLELVYPNGTTRHVPAESYLRVLAGQTESQNLTITSIKLNAGDGWTETVSFFPIASPSEEEEENRIILQISESIFSKARKFGPRGFAHTFTIEAEKRFADEAIAYFHRRFDLEKGTYKASISCTMNGLKVMLKKFEFTLYEHHIKTCKLQTEDYKYGYGVYLPFNENKLISPLISEK